MIRTVTLLSLAALTAATRPDPLAGRTAGPAQECIDLDRVSGPAIGDDNRTILYTQNRQRVWRTEPVGPCPGLDQHGRLIVAVYGGQLCRNDRFQPLRLDQTIPGGVCRFTAFTPYDLPAKTR